MYKLLQINSVVNTGSTGRIAEQLGQYAISQGWESYIAYGREARDSKSKLIQIGSSLDVYKHAIGARLFDCQGLMSKRATCKFLKQLEQIRPDVIHLHNIHGYYINYPILFKYLKNKNIPTVITMHDFWLMTGHCAYINESCDKWKSGCGHCPRLNQYPETKLDYSARNWKRKASIFENMPNVTLVPVSYWLAKYVDESLLHGLKRQVIYNGIDTHIFKPYSDKSDTIGGYNSFLENNNYDYAKVTTILFDPIRPLQISQTANYLSSFSMRQKPDNALHPHPLLATDSYNRDSPYQMLLRNANILQLPLYRSTYNPAFALRS